jgi:methylglutaconyl-CoA hydratase
MPNTIKLNFEPSLAVITLNRPEKRNALNPEMVAELTEAFSAAEADPRCRAVLFRAEGKAFCAGMDLDELLAMMELPYEANLEDSRRLGAMFQRIWSLSKPVVGVAQGSAIAGGCGLASVCDYFFAVPTAKFGYTEVAIGFVPAIVSIYLERVIGKAPAVDLLETGRIIEAHEAKALGLIHEVVSPENLEARAREFALGATKRSRAAVTPEELERACVANAQARFTEKCRAGVSAFLAKRQPR